MPFEVLTYNIQQFPKYFSIIGPFFPPASGSVCESRMEILLQQIRTFDYDVIVFTESFDSTYEARIKQSLSSYPYQSKVLNGSFWTGTHGHFINGGVFLVSKHQFEATTQIFQNGVHSDQYASKGFIHAKFNHFIDGHRINIIATHLQAHHTKEAIEVRQKQLDYLLEYAKENIPCNEIVLLAGDINIDYYSEEFELLKHKGGIDKLTLIGSLKYSFDSESNDYLFATQSEPKAELIDYVFPLGSHQKVSWNMEILRPQKRDFPHYRIGKWFCKFIEASEASDHYPVLGTIV